MISDVVLGKFEKHSRKIDDGPRLQLEILEALEKERLDVEEEAGIGTSEFCRPSRRCLLTTYQGRDR